MPVIVVANPKGGLEKAPFRWFSERLSRPKARASRLSTAILIGRYVTGRRDRLPPTLRVIGDVTESTVISVIQEEAKTRQFVIVDLEGTASRLVSRAIARASFVLIPLQGSAVDAEQASRAVGLIREEEELIERKIPFRLVFTRTSAAIPTRIDKKIVASWKQHPFPRLRHIFMNARPTRQCSSTSSRSTNWTRQPSMGLMRHAKTQ